MSYPLIHLFKILIYNKFDSHSIIFPIKVITAIALYESNLFTIILVRLLFLFEFDDLNFDDDLLMVLITQTFFTVVDC